MFSLRLIGAMGREGAEWEFWNEPGDSLIENHRGWIGLIPGLIPYLWQRLLFGPQRGCWETFCIFACCGVVGNPHLTAKI